MLILMPMHTLILISFHIILRPTAPVPKITLLVPFDLTVSSPPSATRHS